MRGWLKGEENEKATISHNIKSLKKSIIGISEVIDTILVSVKVTKKTSIPELVNESFYGFTGLIRDRKANFYEKNFGFQQYTYEDLGKLVTLRKSYKNFGNNYLTIRISSLQKLLDLLELDLPHRKYGKEVVEKIILRILKVPVSRSHIKLKDLQPAVDIKFDDSIPDEDFFWLAHNLTSIIANLNVRYKIPEFDKSLSTGYFLNRNGDRKIRFYNKLNKEKKSEFINTYRIEYIFDQREIREKLKLKQNRLDNLDKQTVFKFIISDINEILKRNAHTYISLDLKKWKVEKYGFKISDEAIGSIKWKENVNISSTLSRTNEALFNESSSYYKNRRSIEYSFLALMKKEKNFILFELLRDMFQNNYKTLKAA